MPRTDDTSLREAFEHEELERCRQGGLRAVVVGMPIVAVFAVYDVVFFPERAGSFLAMRAAMLLAGIVGWFLLRGPLGHRYPRPIAFVAVLLLGMMTITMTVQTGGRASPYYGGVNIVLLAVTLLLPWPPAWSAATSGGLVVGYVVAIWLSGAMPDTRMFVHNLCFLGSTALIAFWATLFQGRIRWREFETRTRLQQALAHKRDFLASMSHELRSPLHVIIGYADMLLDEPGQVAPDARALVDRVRERGEFLHGMITDLLDAAKMDAGRMDVRLQPVAVGPLVEQVASAFVPIAAQKGVAVRCRIAPALGAVHGDPQRLEQILVNFVGNAVKFTAAGEVTLEAHGGVTRGWLADADFRLLGNPPAETVAAPGVLVAVHDTGIGIRAEDLARLAEDFCQLEDAAYGNYGGTGLGLSISRKLAELLGGFVAVRSAYGVGTTFAIWLPEVAAPAPQTTINLERARDCG